MSLLYRVVAFGQPRAPWRGRKRQAELDAAALGLGEFDDEGTLYLDAIADIQWIRQHELRKTASAHRA